MINIDLTLQQVEELKSFYINELDKIQNRADEIRGILEKFKIKPESVAKPQVPAIKTEIGYPRLTDGQASLWEKPKVEKQKIITPRKETDKQTKWGNMILELLQEKQKPLSIRKIVKTFEKQINIPKTDLKKAISGIQQSLHRLRTYNNKIQSIKRKGKKEKLYGLTEWAKKPKIISLIPEVSKPNKDKNSTSRRNISKTIVKQAGKPPLNYTYNWPEFIKKILNKTKRILTAKEFLKYAMNYYNIPVSQRNNTRGKLSPALSRLEKITKTLKSFKKKGVTGRSYGLSEWFDGDGNLIPEFK